MTEISLPAGDAANKPSATQLLTLFLYNQEYGVDILRVQEIRGWSEPMPIPGAPCE